MVKKTSLIKILLIFLLLFFGIPFCILLINLCIIFPWSPSQLYYTQKPEQADAIIILEGEHYTRIEQAISLIAKGYSKLIIYPGIHLEKNIKFIKDWENNNKFMAKVILNRGPTSTYDEAIQTKKYIKEKNLKKIILVTSSYHSYRSWWIFQKVLPRIKVISVPVPLGSDWFDLKKMKTDSFHQKIFHREQFKFLCYYLFYGWRIY